MKINKTAMSETCIKCDKYKKVCKGIEVVAGKALQFCKDMLSTIPIKKGGK